MRRTDCVCIHTIESPCYKSISLDASRTRGNLLDKSIRTLTHRTIYFRAFNLCFMKHVSYLQTVSKILLDVNAVMQ